jgi:hypothetical protein
LSKQKEMVVMYFEIAQKKSGVSIIARNAPDFLHRPAGHEVGDASHHSGSRTATATFSALVRVACPPAEVVVGEIQVDCGLEVFRFLARGVES